MTRCFAHNNVRLLVRTTLAAVLLLAACMVAPVGAAQERGEQVTTRQKPDSKLRTYATLSVDDVLGRGAEERVAPELSVYGGLLSKKLKSTGYFHVTRSRGRWWMVDPQGHPLIRMSLNSVYRRTKGGGDGVKRPAVPERFTQNGGKLWVTQTTALLRDLGFNGLGRWSNYKTFLDNQQPYPYTTSLSMMSGFGGTLKVTFSKYGHRGYEDNIIPVFHPDFPAYCDKVAQDIAKKHGDDPWLIGHYTDNEMPVPRDLLERTLKVDSKDPRYRQNYIQAHRFLRARHGARGTIEDITKKDNLDFVGHVFKTYYKITSEAMRRHDPNHMVLGSRLHGAGTGIPQISAAAAAHLDVVSYNLYGAWHLPDDRRKMWETAGRRRPFVVSEFCIKGEDSGLDNTDGAGWIVSTQRERGLWYQNFTINLLRSKSCVGWDYFKYRDDVDVNKGVLNLDYQPHPDFAKAMKQLHESAYHLVDKFDRQKRRR